MRRKMIILILTVTIIVGWFLATMASGNRPQLGLDLKGGLSVVLVPVKGSDTSTLDTAVQIIRNRVDGLGVAEPDVSRQGDTVVVDLPGVKDRTGALNAVGSTAELRFRPVAQDQQGKPLIVPYASAPASASSTTTTKPGAVKGSTTTTRPAAPGTTTKKALGRHIDAETIAAVRPEAGPTSTAAGTPSTTAPKAAAPSSGATATTTPAAKASDGTCQNGALVTPQAQDLADKPVVLPDVRKKFCYGLEATVLTGRNVDSAAAAINPDKPAEWMVTVHFRTDEFVKKVATPYVNRQVAIVLDQEVISAPTINSGITGQDVQITGGFSEKEANSLALSLRYGALPVQFDTSQQTVQDISPTLGKDQLRAGIIAGLIGLALVAIYMILLYRLLGVVVWIGLALTGLTFFSLTTWLSVHQGLTLTLAGITGIIVSVGVTVDSYVVYFERLKDEVRTGKTVRSSVDVGFTRAFRTIIAADFVSLLGAIVLYALAAGSVRGFAYFLGLSTALDLILAYCFMYPFVVLLSRRPALVRMPGVGIAAGLDVPEVRS